METTASNTVETTLTVENEHGLHARPADLFVRCANEYHAAIQVYNLSRNPAKKANAKSILGILSIGVHKGDQVRVVAAGDDGAQALAALCRLIETNFQE